MSYCTFCRNLPLENHHKVYHDTQYGFEIDDDNELFGRLILEINQAGLSWDIILKKQDNFRKAFKNYDINKIAAFSDHEIIELLKDSGIIRNKLKINAVIHNAQIVMELQKEFGSFKKWIEHLHPKTKEEWVKIFKKNFKFTGGEIVNEFLMSTGYLSGCHDADCDVGIFLQMQKK